ncbi:M20/M25/M40 family metallo-hydrolase [Caldanaerobacter subterraneus]|uniref:M20/M25/M40 family metallo-hydrolase n=1 Tax=Caldanaerobacter subterraneus TaxID=911092 RepID=UPI003463A0A1
MIEAKELLKALIKKASTDPQRGALIPIISALQSIGLDWKLEMIEEDMYNILLPLSSSPKLIVEVHYDVVPPVIEGYQTKEGEENGRIYGRGTSDVLGGVAILLEVLKRLGREFPWERAGVWIAFVADEEKGGKGSRHLASSLPSTIQYALVIEPTQSKLAFSSCGALEYELIIKGVPSHGSIPERGKNPITWASRFIIKMEEALSKLNTLYNPDIPIQITPLFISGGSEEYSVPHETRLNFDIRIPPKVPISDVEKEVNSLLENDKDVEVHCKLVEEWAPSWETDEDTDFGQLLQKLYKEVYNEEPIFKVMESWTDAHNFWAKGIKPVIWGPGDLALAHTPFEYIDIQELEKGKEFLEKFFYRLLEF